jgi:uncharacterized RDD family membrane protein YckC
MDKDGKIEKKALFLQRFLAFIIDMVIITFLASLISTPFIDQEKVSKLQNQTIEVMESFKGQEINSQEYVSQYVSLYYKTARATGITSLVTIFLSVCYFVVYQTSNKGQTFGKKLMRIRVVSEEGELSYNQMIFRSFIANSILVHLIAFIFMTFGDKNSYFYVYAIFELIQCTILFVSALMIMNRKKGYAIHDRLVHTKVLREN